MGQVLITPKEEEDNNTPTTTSPTSPTPPIPTFDIGAAQITKHCIAAGCLGARIHEAKWNGNNVCIKELARSGNAEMQKIIQREFDFYQQNGEYTILLHVLFNY